MLRTNLSTRPFYNVRAAHVALGAAGLILMGTMVFNVVQVVSLGMSQQSLGARAGEAEEEAARLRTDAARILAQIDPQELQVVSNAAREANRIIDQRAFSWSALLGRFEATLPPDVRLTVVRPRLDGTGDFIVAIGVEAQRAEDLDAFVEALETDGGFRNALAVQAQIGTSGLIEAIIEGTYLPPPDEATIGAPESMDTAPQEDAR